MDTNKCTVCGSREKPAFLFFFNGQLVGCLCEEHFEEYTDTTFEGNDGKSHRLQILDLTTADKCDVADCSRYTLGILVVNGTRIELCHSHLDCHVEVALTSGDRFHIKRLES